MLLKLTLTSQTRFVLQKPKQSLSLKCSFIKVNKGGGVNLLKPFLNKSLNPCFNIKNIVKLKVSFKLFNMCYLY